MVSVDTNSKRIAVGATHPVGWIPRDVVGAPPSPGIALCLSGGGYRATLFHLGALWRLNELGYLPRLDKISSVSGGSITAGQLGLAWPRLGFDSSGVAQNFQDQVVQPVRALTGRTVDVWAVFFGWLGFDVASALRRHLYGPATLQDLPDKPPEFVFNASNVQSGALWRFLKIYTWDWRVGRIDRPRTPLAVAVAASAAFPPVLSPVILQFRDQDFVPGTGADLQRSPFTRRVVLTDGGVYDNLGLETAWKQYATILVSDGSRKAPPEERPSLDWLSHTNRIVGLIHSQVSSVRKRQLIASFESTEPESHREGTYWGIGSDISRYAAPGRLPCPEPATSRLAGTRTRLNRFNDVLQERLINWGYAICDAAMRTHVEKEAPLPRGFPYPASAVG